MPFSTVAICNLALQRLGSEAKISSLEERSPEAKACATSFDFCRDRVLEELPWPFASRRKALALQPETPPAPWQFMYSYPPDCLFARVIVPVGLDVPPAQRIEYALAISDDGETRVILTDQEQAELIYTARVDKSVLFSASFVNALVWKLAAEIGGPIRADVKLRQAAEQAYAAALRDAAAMEFSQPQRKKPESVFVSGRR